MNSTLLIKHILDGIKVFSKIIHEVKINKKQSQRLNERLETIGVSLKQLQRAVLVKESIKPALDRFCKFVDECTNFIKKFAGVSNVKRILAHKKHSDEFQRLNSELLIHVNDLQLNLNIMQLFDRKKDEADRAQDLTVMENKLNEIVDKMVKNQAVLLDYLSNLTEQVNSLGSKLGQNPTATLTITQSIEENRNPSRHRRGPFRKFLWRIKRTLRS